MVKICRCIGKNYLVLLDPRALLSVTKFIICHFRWMLYDQMKERGKSIYRGWTEFMRGDSSGMKMEVISFS